MKHSFPARFAFPVLAIALSAGLAVLAGVSEAQTTQTKAKDANATKAGLKAGAADAQLVSYGGGFESAKSQVVLRPKKMPGDLKPVQKFDFNMWVTIAQAWNQNKTKQQMVVKQFIESKLGLYDVNVRIGDVKLDPKPGDYPTFNKDDGTIYQALIMYVDPAKKSLTLVFTVTGNTMSGTLPVDWWFDQSLQGKFDAKLTMVFDTKGPANNPLVLRSTKVSVRNFENEITDIRLDGVIKTFRKSSFGDGGTGTGVTTSVNTLLRQHTVSNKLGVVTPGMRNDGNIHLAFELSPVPPSLSPAAQGAKK